MSALEGLKSDEEFVDVTLSCEGQTIQVIIDLSKKKENNPNSKNIEIRVSYGVTVPTAVALEYGYKRNLVIFINLLN